MKDSNDPLDTGWYPPVASQFDFIEAVRRQSRVLVLLPLLCLLLGFGYLVIKPSVYSATATLEFDTEGMRNENITPMFSKHITRIRSEETGQRVIERLGMDFGESRTVQPGRLERMITGLRMQLGLQNALERNVSDTEWRQFMARQIAAGLSASHVGDQMALTYVSETPEHAALMANTFAEVYLEVLAERARNQSEAQVEFLRARIEEINQLATAAFEDAVNTRSAANPEMAVPGFLDAQIDRLVARRSELELTATELEVQIAFIAAADSTDIDQLEAVASSIENGMNLFDTYAFALARLEDRREGRANAALVAESEALVQRSREALERQLRLEQRVLERELSVVSARQENVQTQLEAALQSRAMEEQPGIRIAEQVSETLRQINADYIGQIEAAHREAGSVPARLDMIALPPVSSTTSQRVTLLMALALGFFLAVLIASFREWRAADLVARRYEQRATDLVEGRTTDLVGGRTTDLDVRRYRINRVQ